jgi:hypothetical protein
MRFAMFAAAAAVGLGLGMSAASAQEVASVSTCLSMADQVKTAFSDNSGSANFDAARKERQFGQEFCTNGYYARGVAHYARALQLLGVAQKG